jgi:hypothetical protein
MSPARGETAGPTTCDPCDQIKLTKRLDAEEAVRASERTADVALNQARWDSEYELLKVFHSTIAEVASGAIERSRDSAKYVQTAAAAIGSLYAGILALVFSVTDHPLPLRGVYAAVFLGLAVALSTAYLAFITKPAMIEPYESTEALADVQIARSAFLSEWVGSTVNTRRWAIRASVLSLAFGVTFIAAPFVSTAPRVAIPAAPTAPPIPAAVPPVLAKDAARLFRDQVSSYQAAAVARDEAISKAATSAALASRRENRINAIALIFAGLALLVTLLCPTVLGVAEHLRSDRESA